MRQCASKDAGPGRRVDLVGVGVGVPHQLEKGTSASEGVGPRREVDFEISHQLRRRTKHSL